MAEAEKLSKPMKLRLKHYGFNRKEDREVTVQFREIPHYYTGTNVNGNPWRRYEVVMDGEVVGTVEQVTESTDRIYGRIRSPGKGRLAWAWSRPRRRGDRKGYGPVNNSPGVYAPNRINAVASLLGYSEAVKL